MATFDYMVLRQAVKENRVTAICTYAVPGTNNAAGIAWQTIVSQLRALDGETGTSLRPGGDIVNLDLGALKEFSVTVEYDATLSNANKLTQIETLLDTEMTRLIADFASTYNFAGRTGSVSN